MTTGHIVVLPESALQQFTDWGYDIKQPNKAARLAGDAKLATRLFSDDDYGMDVLRIPIYAHAHLVDGTNVVCGSVMKTGEVKAELCRTRSDPGQRDSWDYDVVFDAVRAARKVKPSITIFASLRLVAGAPNSFPNWVKNANGRVDGTKYANLLCRYLQFMNTRGIKVDVLGPDNEGNDIRGDISPGKHDDIVEWLSANCSIRLPEIIGPERMSPSITVRHSITAGEWLNELFTRKGWDAIDLAGIHYYSRLRTKPRYAAALATFAGHANPTGLPDDLRTLWNSEFHWNECKPGRDSRCRGELAQSDPNTTYWDAKLGLMAAFDNFDNGFQGMTWWNFMPWTEPKSHKTWTEDELRAQMQSELVRSTTDAHPLVADDQDGGPMDRGLFITRAFKRGSAIVLWVINDTNDDVLDEWIEVPGKDIDNDTSLRTKTVIRFTRWDNTSRAHGTAELDEDPTDGGRSDISTFRMDFPKKSVTVVTIPDVYPTNG